MNALPAHFIQQAAGGTYHFAPLTGFVCVSNQSEICLNNQQCKSFMATSTEQRYTAARGGIDDLRFGFDDRDASSSLRQTESIDDWSATDDDHVLHGVVSGSS